MTGTTDDVEIVDVRRTHRWRGVLAVALGAVGIGVLFRRPSLLLVATVGVVFAAYPWLSSRPEPAIEIDRRLDDRNPSHGQQVGVTTTVRNVGDRRLFDLRLVDGVPAALSVVDGSPRHGTALGPGESATFSYRIAARQGRHDFGAATAVVRDPSGAHEVEARIAGDTVLRCTSGDAEAPLRGQPTDAVGELAVDRGGTGIEFSRVRAYQRGDPVRRIDWRRYARSGDLTTIQFREERMASVVVLVDARESAYRARDGEPHGAAYSVAVARELLDDLLETRNRFGLAAVGRESCWAAPGASGRHREECERLLDSHVAFAASPPESCPPLDEQLATLRARLGDQDQVLLCSPLCDDGIAAARRLDAAGHAVSVVSVDVTAGGTPGTRLAALERDARVRRLRNAGVPVVDWQPGDPIAPADGASGVVRS
ncbi:MAG: DUF58 domain-containing protein [Haloarculaceae archaeon]